MSLAFCAVYVIFVVRILFSLSLFFFVNIWKLHLIAHVYTRRLCWRKEAAMRKKWAWATSLNSSISNTITVKAYISYVNYMLRIKYLMDFFSAAKLILCFSRRCISKGCKFVLNANTERDRIRSCWYAWLNRNKGLMWWHFAHWLRENRQTISCRISTKFLSFKVIFTFNEKFD